VIPILCALLAITSSCGYSAGSLTRPGFERVHLQMFGNETFYRDFERDLTRQVARELSSRPGIFITPLDSADIVLRGTVIDFRQRVLSEDDRDRIRESSALIRVRIEILDAHDPRRLLKKFEVADRAEFQLARGENLATATDESFFDLARRVVDGLETELQRASVRTESSMSESSGVPEEGPPP